MKVSRKIRNLPVSIPGLGN